MVHCSKLCFGAVAPKREMCALARGRNQKGKTLFVISIGPTNTHPLTFSAHAKIRSLSHTKHTDYFFRRCHILLVYFAASLAKINSAWWKNNRQHRFAVYVRFHYADFAGATIDTLHGLLCWRAAFKKSETQHNVPLCKPTFIVITKKKDRSICVELT